MAKKYTHRNGERELPQVAGFYFNRPTYQQDLDMVKVTKEFRVWVMGSECDYRLTEEEFLGSEWWGPIELPEIDADEWRGG